MCSSETLHIVDLWRYYVCCTLSDVTRYSLFMVLYLSCMSRCLFVTRGAVIAHRCTYTPPRCSSAGLLLFFCQYLCGTILVTPYSMVWDWQVQEQGQCLFYWPCCSLTFCLLQFFLSCFSFYGLVLWGWGLRTDRVLITLSQPCTAYLF